LPLSYAAFQLKRKPRATVRSVFSEPPSSLPVSFYI